MFSTDNDRYDMDDFADCDRCGCFVNVVIPTHTDHGDVCGGCFDLLAEEAANA